MTKSGAPSTRPRSEGGGKLTFVAANKPSSGAAVEGLTVRVVTVREGGRGDKGGGGGESENRLHS